MYKKVSGRTGLFPLRAELGCSKDWYVSNITLYWNGKVNSILGSTLPKLPIISENGSNKCCWALNFKKKKVSGCICIFFRSGARVLERLICFKYYTVLKWKSRFILGLNAVEIANYMYQTIIVQKKVVEN